MEGTKNSKRWNEAAGEALRAMGLYLLLDTREPLSEVSFFPFLPRAYFFENSFHQKSGDLAQFRDCHRLGRLLSPTSASSLVNGRYGLR